MNQSVVTRAGQVKKLEFEWGDLTWLVAKDLGNSEEMTVGLSRIKAGAMNPRHYHPNCVEVLHVLQGTILHTMDDEEVALTPGDTVSIPPNVVHNARNTGDAEAVLFICFSSPERETVWV